MVFHGMKQVPPHFAAQYLQYMEFRWSGRTLNSSTFALAFSLRLIEWAFPRQRTCKNPEVSAILIWGTPSPHNEPAGADEPASRRLLSGRPFPPPA